MRLRLALAAVPFLVAVHSQAGTLGFSLGSPTILGVAGQSPGSLLSSWIRGRLADEPTVTVMDDETLQPIAGATVKVTASLPELMDPAAATAATDDQGVAAIALSGKVVTASKGGYATTSVVGVNASSVTIFLRHLLPASADASPVVSGTMGDYQVPNDGSHVRAGFVFRALSVSDLLQFDLGSVISPLKDTINVMGSHEIPSNIVLPKQKITVIFAPITLDKQKYRLPISSLRETRLVGVQGQMDTSDLVSIATGGGGYTPEMLNKIEFSRMGMTDMFTPADGATQTVAATLDLKPGRQATVKDSPYGGDIVVAAITDINGDRQQLVPTDIKDASGAGTVELRGPAQKIGAREGTMAIALDTPGHRLSGAVSTDSAASVSFGDFLDNPPIADYSALPASVTIHAPANSVAVAAFSGSAGPAWYVFSLPSAGDVAVPTAAQAAAASYAVSQLEFGALNEASLDGLKIMQDLRRFSRAEGRRQ